MKKIIISVLSIFIIVVGMWVSYTISTSQLKELTPEVRKDLPGDFVTLKDGVISYYWKGPQDGEIVILVHGLSTPKFVWDGNTNALTSAGYRVLAFDHYGRGFSDRPSIKYNEDLYIREISGLITAFSITKPVNLVGYSMGGGIVISFAAQYPEKVKQLILIAPAGYVPPYSGLASLVLIPGLGDWLMAMLGKKRVMEEIQKEVKNGTALPNMVDKFEEQFQYKGYLPSILSTMRHYPMYDLSEAYEKVGKSAIPTAVIWGTEDSSVPFDGSIKVKEAIPQVKIFPIKGAKHSVTYARTAVVNKIILNVLNKSVY
jgi:pimeloyl-ACP methyl ester carboxylesterase